MVEDVLTEDGEGQVVSVRRCYIHVPTSALIAAQPASAKSAAARAAPRSTTLTAPAFDQRAESKYFADAQVKAHIARPGGEIVRE